MALSGLFSSVTPAANGIPMADGSGLIAQGWMFGVKPAHSIFAGPVSGADADPAFRALVAGDIPDLSSIYVPVTRQINTGTGLSGGGALSSDLTLAVTGNLATLFSLADGAGWLHNDGAGVLAYSTPTPSDIGLSAGNSITLTGGVIDTIQDIRTSASPTFANVYATAAEFTTVAIPYNYPITGQVMTSDSTSNHTAIQFNNPNDVVGSIVTSGFATAFNTSSDRRLKIHIRDYTASGPVIDAIQPRIFDWKTGEKDSIGFVAQELYPVAPYAVTTGDADPDAIHQQWQVDYSKLVPVLVAEIKSLRARLDTLEALTNP